MKSIPVPEPRADIKTDMELITGTLQAPASEIRNMVLAAGLAALAGEIRKTGKVTLPLAYNVTSGQKAANLIAFPR
jgi:hypothetical protein